MASLKLNFLYNVLLNVSKVIFPLITAPYISRVLDPDGVGLFNFANTYASYFTLFAALGIPFYGVREIAKMRNDIKAQTKFVSEIISISLLTTVLCTFLFVCTIIFIQQLNENSVLFIIAGIILYLTPFRIEWYFQGKEEFGYITFRSLLIKIISVVLLFIVVKDKSDLINYILLNVIAISANEIWNYVKLIKSGIRPYLSTKGCFVHIKPLLLLFASSIAISIYTMLDTLMLGFMTNYAEVGYYNSASHIAKSLLPIATSLSIVAMPRLSYYLKENLWSDINVLLNKSLSVVSFLCFPIMCGVIAVAPIFIPLFLGAEFVGAIMPLQIIIGVVVAIGLNNLTGVQVLVGLGYDKLFLYSVIFGTISNFILNVILIPIYGASGAAFSSVLAETIILFVTYYFVVKKTSIRLTNWQDLIKSIIGSLSLFPIYNILSSHISGWHLVISYVIIGGTIYLAIQYILKNSAIIQVEKIIISKLNKP